MRRIATNTWTHIVVLLTIFAIAVLVTSCSPPSNAGDSPSGANVYYWHDDTRSVSCWLYGSSSNAGKAISCIPDRDLK